jgi:hypothetical protein
MNPVWEQEYYRLRSDETAADPGTPVWISTVNQATRTNIALDTLFRVRFVVANTSGNNGTATFSLYASHNSGTYTEVAASGTAVITADATTPTDADALTTANFQLTAGTGTAVNGQYDENNSIASFALNKNSYTEFEFCVQLNSAVVSVTDTIDLRVYADDAAFDGGGGSYDTNATAIITAITAPHTAEPGVVDPGLDLTGQAPDAVQPKVIEPGKVALALDVRDDAPTINRLASPSKGFLTLFTFKGLYLAGQNVTVVESGAGNVSKEPGVVDPGLDLTGKVPTLAWTIEPDVVDPGLDLTGKAPTLDFTFEPSEDTLDLTGKQATLAWTIEPTEDTLDLTGKQATLAWTIEPDVVDPGLDLTGKQPDAQNSGEGNVEKAPTEDTLDLTGKVPTLDFTFEPSEDTLDLTGKAPTLDFTFEPSEDTLDLTGKVPTLDFTFEPSEDTLDLTGKQATLAWTIEPDVVDPGLDLTGKAPTLDFTFKPDEDTLDLTGKQATLAWTIEPGEDTLDLTGKQPDALDSGESSFTKVPGEDTLTLTGAAPTAITFAEPGAGTLNLDGKVPEALPEVIAVGKGGLHLTGPEPLVSHFTNPSPGALTLFSVKGLQLRGITPTVVRSSPPLTPNRVVRQLNGKQPALAWSIEPDKGTANLDGKLPVRSTSGATEIPVAPGALRVFSVRGLLLRGITPSTLIGTIKAPNEGTLDLDGKAPGLTFFSPEAGSPTLLGKTPFVGRGFSYEIPVDEGGVSLSGKNPIRPVGLLIRGRVPTADRSSETNKIREPARYELALTGQDVYYTDTSPQPYIIPVSKRPLELQQQGNVALETIDPTAQSSLILNGMQPTTVDTSPTFLLGADNLALTPKLPFINPVFEPDAAGPLELRANLLDVLRSTNARPLPGKGSIALSGKELSIYPQPGTAPLTLSGHVPATGKREIRVNRQQLLLTGQIPTRLEQNYTVYPGRPVLRILRNDTNYANVGFTLSPSNDSLTAAGKVPLFEYDTDTSRIPKKQNLVLTPQLPNLRVDTTIEVGGSQLVISNEQVKTKEKRFRRYGARNRFVRLTTRYTIELLYR